MSSRRKGREAAVQFLCGLDTQGFPSSEETERAMEEFFAMRPVEERAMKFSRALVTGILSGREEIDEQIARFVKNFKISRLGLVERNILRLALFEIASSPDVPPVVVINEAVEIGKKFGTEDSGRFLNGILDRAAAEIGRPLRQPCPMDWVPGREIEPARTSMPSSEEAANGLTSQ